MQILKLAALPLAALAITACDLMTNPALLDAARAEFAERGD